MSNSVLWEYSGVGSSWFHLRWDGKLCEGGDTYDET